MVTDTLTGVLNARRVEALDGQWLRLSDDDGDALERALEDVARDGGWTPEAVVAADVRLPGPWVVAIGDGPLARLACERGDDGRLRVTARALPPDAEAGPIALDGTVLT